MNAQLIDQYDLARMRAAAGLTQPQIAEMMGVSQPQVSRWEADPDNMTAGQLRKFVSLCGEATSARGLQVQLSPTTVELKRRLELIEAFVAEKCPAQPANMTSEPPVDPGAFLAGLKISERKFRLGLFGMFDAGKSRFVNEQIGGNCLPTAYQPNTSVTCLIRHMSDKPSFQVEDVWMFRAGFDIEKASDMEHCNEHKLVAGGYETLQKYGTHAGDGRVLNASAAVVYVDSPLLLDLDIVDNPGYGNNDRDAKTADAITNRVDAAVYCSPLTGFLANQLDYLRSVLTSVAPLSSDPRDSLRNIFVVATHAHSVHGPIEHILDAAASRAWKHLEDTIQERSGVGSTSEVRLEFTDFRSRFFGFAAERMDVRQNLENDLRELVEQFLPALRFARVETYVARSREEAPAALKPWIDQRLSSLNEQARAQQDIQNILEEEPARQRKRALHVRKIEALCDQGEAKALAALRNAFTQRANISAIESMIRARYPEKKDARELAPSYLLEAIQAEVNAVTKAESAILAEEVENYLDGFVPETGAKFNASSFAFNSRAVFISALSGAGAVGALAAWAAIAAAGSNLGGYILIAQIVSFLASIGISLGGVSTVISAVAAIGGPVTLLISAGLLVFMLGLSIFGDSWQLKLSKQIHKGFIEQRVEEKIADAVRQYWDNTRKAFADSVKVTEETFARYLQEQHNLAYTTDPAVLREMLVYGEELRDFFAGLPWRVTMK
jgi:transcriptional regulator with XRE-family HTH domain